MFGTIAEGEWQGTQMLKICPVSVWLFVFINKDFPVEEKDASSASLNFVQIISQMG